MTHISLPATIPKRAFVALAIATAIGGIAFSPTASAHEEHGNILIADQFNNRVIEIDPDTHRVLWHFGNGSDLPGPNSIVGVNDAERFGIGDLHLLDMLGIPHRLQEAVGKAEHQQVLGGFLAQKMIDAQNLLFFPVAVHLPAQFLGAGQISGQ